MIRLGAMALLLACTGCGGGGSVVVENAAPVPVEPLNAVAMPVEAPPALDPSPAAEPALTENELQVYPEARGFPGDVQRHLVRRQDCEHWTGEEPYDAARKAEIEANVTQLCTGIDAETATLRARHANDPGIAEMLGKLDTIGM